MRELNSDKFVISSPENGILLLEGEECSMCRCVICLTGTASSKSVVILCRECTISFLIAERAMLRAKKEMLSQCCRCGLILNGSFKGIIFLQENNEPNKEAGESHGLCDPCGEKTWFEWKQRSRKHSLVS